MTTRRAIVALAVVAVVGLAWASLVQGQAGAQDTKGLMDKEAPDFTLKTLDGKEIKLSSLKGQVVVVDFWATWCPPCRASLPHLQAMSVDKDLAAKGLVVLAVNVSEKSDTVSDFMKENKFTFAVPMDAEGKTMKSYRVNGIPTTVIVGRDGKIKEVFVGFAKGRSETSQDNAVEKALAESKPAA